MTSKLNKSASKQKKVQDYTDAYFESGHWGIKIWQTLVGLVGWLAVFIPLIMTILSVWASYDSRIHSFWYYQEGLFEFKFIGILLLFFFALAALFAVSMTIIQNRKRDRVVEQWPTFNPISQKKRQQLLDQFMDDRFGDAEFRENARYYHVKPEQNLDTEQIQQLYREHDLDDLEQ